MNEEWSSLPQEKQFYLPESLGLDPQNPVDMNLYIDSGGDEIIARHMLTRRELNEEHSHGVLDDEKYQYYLDQIESLIANRRREINSE